MAQRKARRSASKKTKAAGKRPAPKRKAIRRPARKAAPVPNKRVAETLGITEQGVANQKFEFLERLRSSLRKQRLAEDLFPELYENN